MGAVTTADATQLPAHLAKHFAVAPNTDLTEGAGGGGFPVISYKGKVWAVSKGGDRTILTNADGDPRASIDVVILKANGSLSKNYYATGYSEGSNEKPDCYSADGTAPAADAVSPQSNKCAICPKNQWGSRMSDTGGKGKACADSRRMAVAAPEDIEEVMLLRVPAASLKPLAEYAKALDKRKVPYQAMVTKIGFNPESAHPEFTFKPVRWLSEAEGDLVAELQDSERVTTILAKAPHFDESPAKEPAAEPVDDFLPPREEPKPAAKKVEQVVEEAPEVEAEEVKPAPKPRAKKVEAVETASSLDDLLARFDDL